MVCEIMLVDDDLDDRELFAEALSEVDASVRLSMASSAANAFGMLSGSLARLPDVIFLDINMPITSGWDCLSMIREKSEFSSIPVIMYSTSNHVRETEIARGLGAAGLIPKPSDFEILKQNLREILRYLRNGEATPLLFQA